MEYWADAPEIQRSADLYEDLIKCCVADALSEVGIRHLNSSIFMIVFNIEKMYIFSVLQARATARACYRMFTKTWPERSHQLFMSFDPAIQRVCHLTFLHALFVNL